MFTRFALCRGYAVLTAFLLSVVSCGEAAIESVSGYEGSPDQPKPAGTEEHAPVIDYAPVPFDMLVGTADLVLVGRLDEVRDGDFRFQIDQSLLNGQQSDSIDVLKRVPLPIFAPRATPYEPHQRFVLFLMRSAESGADSPWMIVGAAGEGEMPIDDESVYFDTYELGGLEFESHEVHGVVRNTQRFDLDDFKDAVANYRNCFSWRLEKRIQNNKVRERWVAARICGDDFMRTYRGKSWIHEYLTQETLRRIPADGNG